MSNSFDPQRLAFKRKPRTQTSMAPLPRHKTGEYFLMGPIPWEWLCLAAKQPGRALHVAIALWFLAFVNKTGTVRLSGTVLRMLGVSRSSAYRGLNKLVEAGLVTALRHSGRNPIVTILAIENGDEPE